MYQRLLLPLLLFFSLLAASPALATHIVGGEFAIRYLRPESYRITLTLYFDAINGSAGALDERVVISLWGKSNNQLMDTTSIYVDDNDVYVPYTNPACALASQQIRTRVLTYRKDITLLANRYLDPRGYYAVWQRCCRNGVINNIERPDTTGQAFYMEFAGPMLGSESIINSSPQLFKPVSDFACVGDTFRFDYSGFDPDGDSLAYAMSDPFAGGTTPRRVGTPGTSQSGLLQLLIAPQPYRRVVWTPGFNTTNQIAGPVPLNIDTLTGILTMVPRAQGLFVFAVECREYRRGRQIGLVRREYQILVKDCAFNAPPDISLENTDSARGPIGGIAAGDTVTITDGQAVNLSIYIKDTIADTQFITVRSPAFGSRIVISNASGPARKGQPFNTTIGTQGCLARDTIVTGPVTLYVRDNGCPIPKQDSITFILRVLPGLPPRVTAFSKDSAEGDTIRIRPLTAQAFSFSIQDPLYPTQGQILVTPPLPAGATLRTSFTTTDQGRTRDYTATISLPCSKAPQPVYRLRAIGLSSRCNVNSLDTVDLFVSTVPILATPRLIVIDSATRDTLVPERMGRPPVAARPGQRVVLLVYGQASDTGLVAVASNLSSLPGGATWQPAAGRSPQLGRLVWPIACQDAFGTGAPPQAESDTALPSRLYQLSFSSLLNRCDSLFKDSGQVQVRVSGDPLLPVFIPNLITANGDSVNDVFRTRLALVPTLCQPGFEYVEIYNRWGRRQLRSTDPGFAWRPSADQAGMYYFILAARGRRYRGWLEVVR